jgi:hypothetical protein
MLRKKPEIAPPIGSGVLARDLRERVSAEERGFLAGLSLLANIGVTLAQWQMVVAVMSEELSKADVVSRQRDFSG